MRADVMYFLLGGSLNFGPLDMEPFHLRSGGVGDFCFVEGLGRSMRPCIAEYESLVEGLCRTSVGEGKSWCVCVFACGGWARAFVVVGLASWTRSCFSKMRHAAVCFLPW
jgi:hypothetical protein